MKLLFCSNQRFHLGDPNYNQQTPSRTETQLHSLYETKKYCTELDTLSRQISPKAFCDLANCGRNPIWQYPSPAVEFVILVSGHNQFSTFHPKHAESKMARCCLAAETRCVGNPLNGYCVSIIGSLRFQRMWLGCFVVIEVPDQKGRNRQQTWNIQFLSAKGDLVELVVSLDFITYVLSSFVDHNPNLGTRFVKNFCM